MTKAASCMAGLLLMASGAALAERDHPRVKVSDVGSEPVIRTIRESSELSPTGRVEVSGIGGNVEVSAGKGNKVELVYERRAATPQDLDCETLRHEATRDEVRIRLDQKRDKACRLIRADDKLVLTVPRGAELSIESIGSSVKVTGVEGLVQLDSIGDDAILEGVQQVKAESIGDTLKLSVTKLGPEGIRIDSVGDDVEMTLPSDVDARLRIRSVGDEIRAAGVRLTNGDHDTDSYETVLGKGGAVIRITSVGDTVVINGPQLRVTRGEKL